MSIPFYYTIAKAKENSENNFEIKKVLLKDFQGVEEINNEIVHSISEFSFHLTMGNMDEAYKAVKSI